MELTVIAMKILLNKKIILKIKIYLFNFNNHFLLDRILFITQRYIATL